MKGQSSSSSDDSDCDVTRTKRSRLELRRQVLNDDYCRKINYNETTSGSEETSEKDRDSDSSSSGSSLSYVPAPKRRTPVKQSEESVLTQESFLQNDSCSKIASQKEGIRLSKCRECYKSTDTNQYSCRFYSFRKLRFTKNKCKPTEGFLTPFDATEEDTDLWLPKAKDQSSSSETSDYSMDSRLDVHMARFILMQVGDQFCDLFHQEEDAINLHMGETKTAVWKKPMQGVREMCDVCKTTLFNFHWACERCGFVVCIDCYKVRCNGEKRIWMVYGSEHDEWKWLKCNNRQPHDQDKLMLCQIIAKDCLQKLGKLVHDVRETFGIPQNCKCVLSQNCKPLPGLSTAFAEELVKLDPLKAIISYLERQPGKVNDSTEHEARVVTEAKKQKLPDEPKLSDDLLSAGFIQVSKEEDSSTDSEEEEETNGGTIYDLLVSSTSNSPCPIQKNNTSDSRQAGLVRTYGRSTRSSSSSTRTAVVCTPPVRPSPVMKTPKASADEISDFIRTEVVTLPTGFADKHADLKRASSQIANNNKKWTETPIISSFETEQKDSKKMHHFVRRYRSTARANPNQLPPRMMTLVESKTIYPSVHHSWLCDGKLLRLIDPSDNKNYHIFEDQWRRGQPVIVGNMTKLLNMDLWHPEAFCKDFGDDRNDLVNCSTGNLVPNRPMREFWEGFEHFSKRLKDEHGEPMLLKLKDWPPGEDFAEMLPNRFKDLMQALPLAEYTHRTGRLNLASCLPDFFVRPDLGPKMYNAYGSALYPSKGTTNLHLDISDAVNFMVYVGIPKDGNSEEHIQEAFFAIDEAGCDEVTRRRVRTKEEMPGALWHIYHASDADKIRDLLNKVAIDNGTRLEPHHDPIHDQSWYLDKTLRERLYREYGVSGYAIVQCLGDAVFIPAGAPHQVRNLHNCVKVAEDFVSPENVSQCFHLTQEFRELSDTHTNHEDKLQIKNIIYHTIKSAISSLLSVCNIDPGSEGSESASHPLLEGESIGEAVAEVIAEAVAVAGGEIVAEVDVNQEVTQVKTEISASG